MFRCVVTGMLAAAALAFVPAAGAQVQPYGTNDYGDFNNILPPGQGSLDNLVAVGEYEANHNDRPAHWIDQEQMYSNLTTAAPNIQESQIGDYYKDATFGVPAGDVASTESPEPGVTIVRDTAFGVPHIYGDTRAELEFGIGWATAEDRLFMIDVLRHVGEGTLGSFAGGSNVSLDETTWTSAPYTPQDYQNQINWAEHASPYSAQIFSDVQNYVDGINAYITMAEANPINEQLYLPGEYEALGYLNGPQPFTLSDVIAIATIIGAELGNGGGVQLQNALLYESMKKKLGAEHYSVPGSPQLVKSHRAPRRFRDRSGYATFSSFESVDNPAAPTTVHGKRFPYETLSPPSKAELKTIALPDPGSVKLVNPVIAGSVPGAGSLLRRPANGVAGQIDQNIAAIGQSLFPHAMSNALLISARDSASGHPLMVAGPQVSYFSPEILMEEDIHGPGIDAEGASFPGTNIYVELGHGPNYAWSATSASQNIIDTFAVPLCNPSGGTVSFDSDYYLMQGKCVQMQTLTHPESWTPNLADSTPAGSVTFEEQRTAYGLVIARARIHRRPVVYTNLRTTYMHELDSIVGFYLLNSPQYMTSVQHFYKAAYHIDYTFNWFFANTKHIAYFDSGLNPVRARHTDPMFPTWASDDWRGFHPSATLTPASTTERNAPEGSHPHVMDQAYLTSWNNKEAPGYNNAGTSLQYSSIYRSQLLDLNINHFLAVDHGKLTLADLIDAMGNAGTQDLRGVEVLPYALKIIGHPKNPTLASAVAQLRAWVASGAHRINRQNPGASGLYDQSNAIKIIDAWWPLWVKAEFQPLLGPSILGQMEGEFPINDEPGHGTTCCHVGSSFDVGFYGIAQADLQDALGQRISDPLNRIYCGNGSLKRCRAALESSLMEAIGEPYSQVYPADSDCAAGDQMCSDSIQYRSLGVVGAPAMEWINRSTFQQADDLTGQPAG